MSSPTDPAKALVARAKTMASCFQDDELRQAIVRWERSADVGPDLEAEMDAAAQRAYTAAVSRLKSAHDLREQQVVTQRFLKTTEVLLEQVQARLEGIADCLRFQNEMFDEDVRAFIDSSLDAIELRMRETVRGRPNWTEEATWEAFRNGAAYAELRARFEPLRAGTRVCLICGSGSSRRSPMRVESFDGQFSAPSTHGRSRGWCRRNIH